MLADYKRSLWDSSARRFTDGSPWLWFRWRSYEHRRWLRILLLGLPGNGESLILNLQASSVAVARALLVKLNTTRAGRQLKSAFLFRLSTGLAACRRLATIDHVGVSSAISTCHKRRRRRLDRRSR